MIALRDHQAYLADDLALAAAAVRMHRADDVCLAIPWSRQEVIDSCTAAFLRTPAEIHLDADRLLERFGEARFVAPRRDLRPARHPPAADAAAARSRSALFDLAFSSAALVALAPFLFAVALLIRRESPGPALFRQTRYGFNQEPFRIFKFRTMRTMEDGAKVVAAKRDDPRVTRLGAYLRRYSIDELPQLFNVLRGEMSIVGPRPHAMAHDQRYVDRLSPLRAPPQRQAGHHRLGAGARPPRRDHQRPGNARPARSRSLLRRQLVAVARHQDRADDGLLAEGRIRTRSDAGAEIRPGQRRRLGGLAHQAGKPGVGDSAASIHT